jgi:hypothetical protein
LYNVSGGLAGLLAFPQVFHPQYARDWYAVKRWSMDTRLPIVDFAGVMSECGSNPCEEEEEAHPDINFTPEESFQLLWQHLNGDPDEDMQQGVEQVSEVRCSNGSEDKSCEP